MSRARITYSSIFLRGLSLCSNIRRYADNAPPPEPQDLRAHLLGGIPEAEVEAKHPLFEAHGFNPTRILVERKT